MTRRNKFQSIYQRGKILTLRNGLIFERIFIFFLAILLVTFLGYLSMPATSACPKGLSVVPSSVGFTMTAFLPANLPESTRTTLPAFIIFPMIGSEGGRIKQIFNTSVYFQTAQEKERQQSIS